MKNNFSNNKKLIFLVFFIVLTILGFTLLYQHTWFNITQNLECDQFEDVEYDDLNQKEVISVCHDALKNEPDNPKYLFLLGLALEKDGQYKRAIKLQKEAAEKGYVDAYYSLGDIYEYGIGVEEDLVKAAKWYLKAAENGHLEGSFRVGLMYEYGEGVEKNFKKAMEWYHAAASKEHLEAQYQLSIAYEHGDITEIDCKKAKKYQKIVIDRGHIWGHINMSLNLKGDSNCFSTDRNKAFKLMKKVTKMKDAASGEELQEALNWLGLYYSDGIGVPSNYEKSLEYFVKAAEMGSSYGMNNVGNMYEHGDGVEVNFNEAANWYEKAAELDNNLAQENLGRFYENGLGGLQVDFKQAYELYKLSAEQNNLAAMMNLARMYELGLGVQQNYNKSLEWYTKASKGNNEYAGSVSSDIDKHIAEAKIQSLQTLDSKGFFEEEVNKTKNKNDISFGSYHALIIGNNNYNNLPKLKNAINDAKAVSKVLENKFNFNTNLIEDANREQILDAIYQLREINKNDNILIYYSGHGYQDIAAETAYWQPVDAKENKPSSWIHEHELKSQLRAINAKHVMIIADSCFSGSLLRGIEPINIEKVSKKTLLERNLKKRIRVAFTSGGEEPVLDGGGGKHSVFAKSFLEVLDKIQEPVEGRYIFKKVSEKLAFNVKQQPQYDPIMNAGGERGGDFIFLPNTLE